MNKYPSPYQKAYYEKLKDPRWQKLRLKIFKRDGWACQKCSGSEDTLVVHHMYYAKDKEPWEAPENSLVTLCDECHSSETHDRPDFDKRILRSMKRLFTANDLNAIANGLDNVPFTDIMNSGFIADALREVLSDKEALSELVGRYLYSKRTVTK